MQHSGRYHDIQEGVELVYVGRGVDRREMELATRFRPSRKAYRFVCMKTAVVVIMFYPLFLENMPCDGHMKVLNAVQSRGRNGGARPWQ
jgi:hypothetical protein